MALSVLAALPSDVRKVWDFPVTTLQILFARRSLGMIFRESGSVRHTLTAHQAASRDYQSHVSSLHARASDTPMPVLESRHSSGSITALADRVFSLWPTTAH